MKIAVTELSCFRTNFEKLNEQRLVGKYCDLTLVCEGKEFSVHKSVLAASSEYFEAMFESGLKESKSEKIELEGFTPDSLEVVLDYLYTGQGELNLNVALEALNVFSMMMLNEAVQQIDSELVKEASTNLEGVLGIVLEFSGVKKSRETVIDLIIELAPSERSIIIRKLNGDVMSGLVQRGGKKCDPFFALIVEWMKDKTEDETAPIIEKLDLSQLATSNVLLAFTTLYTETNVMTNDLLYGKCIELYKKEKCGVIRFTIPSVSKLGCFGVCSTKIALSDLVWQCRVKRRKSDTGDSMSFYLMCGGNSEIESFECEVVLAFTLLGVQAVQKVSQNMFKTGKQVWGYDSFIPWNTFVDPTKGFVTNDEARVEIEIFIQASSNVWKL